MLLRNLGVVSSLRPAVYLLTGCKGKHLILNSKGYLPYFLFSTYAFLSDSLLVFFSRSLQKKPIWVWQGEGAPACFAPRKRAHLYTQEVPILSPEAACAARNQQKARQKGDFMGGTLGGFSGKPYFCGHKGCATDLELIPVYPFETPRWFSV